MSNEFSWSSAREARIDRAIDRAVRDMIQIDPQPGLRRRVLARLHESQQRQRVVLPWAQLAFGIVAAMLVLMAVPGLWSRGGHPAPPPPPAMAIGAPAPAVDIESVIQQPIVRGESVSTPGQVTREEIRMPRVANVFGNRRGEVSAASTRKPSRGNARRIAPESLPPLRIVPRSARPIVLLPRVLPAPSKGGQ